MYSIYIKDFNEWRAQARDLLAQNIRPEQIQWLESNNAQSTLFNEHIPAHYITHFPAATFNVSRTFIELAKKVACHRSLQKWSLLYTALWRMQNGEKHLLQLSTDDVVYELLRMQKAVSRDAHKMTAFVRFKLYQQEDKELYIAWHKPDHNIIKLVAPFFQKRFSVMCWVIVTPDGAAFWDGKTLQFDESITSLKEPLQDEMEDLWRTYYRSIFNPARIKLKAMRREMPVRHWQTLPETDMIPLMLQEAPQRVAQMIKTTEGFAQSAADFIPAEKSIENMRIAAAQCQGCTLYNCATQTVFGVGPANASIMLVGEQPGDYEDQIGIPFTGPAGKVLDQLLNEANIDREKIYLTNAVKHFKHTLQNNRRIHVSPNIRDITACKPWLLAEIETIKPKYIICLGLKAAKALISHGFHMKEQRGKWMPFSDTQQIMATYHPSAVLRAVNEEQQKDIYNFLLNDLKKLIM